MNLTREDATAEPATPVAHETPLLARIRRDGPRSHEGRTSRSPRSTRTRRILDHAYARRNRQHLFSIAQGSAMECAAAIGILRVTGYLSQPEVTRAKHKLTRIFQMLVGLRRR